MNISQEMALLMAGLLFLIIILLIAILIRTRRLGPEMPLLVEEEEDTTAALPPIIVRRAPWIGLDEPRISRYPLVDLRRRINGLLPTPILNIQTTSHDPPPPGPIMFGEPNGATIGRGPRYYK
jgi:hypothetical protein